MTDDLLDTDAAAKALHIPVRQLERWVQAGVVTPAVTDPDGAHRWNLPDLRQQLAGRLDDREP